MKKTIFLFLLLQIVIGSAQSQRFLYEYKIAPDSTRRDSVIVEMMRLDVLPKGSKYYSQNVYMRDSIMDSRMKKNELVKNADGGDMIISNEGTPHGVIEHKVYKTYPDFKINFINKIWPDFYNQTDDRKITWRILSDKQKIGKWDCQKAETNFAGRKWIAWFTSSIPIQDGPYKFRGLPGLIVKVTNQNETISFELKGVQSIVKQNLDDDFEKQLNPIPVTYQQYVKLYKNYLKDPIAGLRKAYSDKVFEMYDASGNLMPQEKVLKDYDTRAREQLKKNNNTLEPDLLK
ncbi:GLPGLI family protein [Soonwooa sp.]|uniref:GLPGLI family protein n=1 Tax=Soonwooa sp. TaxID=1938592 RepID=UPI002627A239|nr:GLPGLI family protein [Soonwooa sp.]